MSYKKMLVIILVVVLAMFGLMLTTSYAWYSFEAGSTTFNGVTNNDDVEITFLKGEYINNTVGVPILAEEVDKYSDKHQFTVKTKNNKEDNEILLKISLIEGTMSSSLRVSEFKVDLYHQGTLISSHTGSDINFTSGVTTKSLGNVVLNNDVDNQFELRVYLLDNGENQSSLMNLSFQAKIQVEVVSRLKTTVGKWDAPDIYVSSITIDGTASDYIPTDGYYKMTSTCTKGTTLTWDGVTKTIIYPGGSKINDSCALTFTSGTSPLYLNKVEPGSYVEYIGTNGCDGNHCEGDNANYVSDNKMGSCFKSDFLFTENGWRVGYVSGKNAYLVSAGSVECMGTYQKLDTETAFSYVPSTDATYYFGSDYGFDSKKGYFLKGEVTKEPLKWSANYGTIINSMPYTCRSDTDTSCGTLYKLSNTSTAAQMTGVSYSSTSVENTVHVEHLNRVARTYCNKKYAYNGVCDESSAWAMNGRDFENIVGNSISSGFCYNNQGNQSCGYANDLIDNGGYYWYALSENNSSTNSYFWTPSSRIIYSQASSDKFGLRPVIRIASNIIVVGGSGTYDDPYQIDVGEVEVEDDVIVDEEIWVDGGEVVEPCYGPGCD